jgi:hypothetical protein
MAEISLHKGNVHLSESCRQALLQIRTYCRFEDLVNFFANYGE